MVTYAHENHSTWKVGNKFYVWLYKQSSVVVEVTKIHKNLDVIWLKTNVPVDIPKVNQHLPFEGQLYIQLGYSADQQLGSPFNSQIGKKLLSHRVKKCGIRCL